MDDRAFIIAINNICPAGEKDIDAMVKCISNGEMECMVVNVLYEIIVGLEAREESV